MSKVKTHPIQTNIFNCPERIPEVVTRRAYEVYCQVWSPQPALVDDEKHGCRGGFSVSEMVAFLYARSFSKEEWRARYHEAITGMEYKK